jgi:oligopeptide/dipeptide ABC transporter ATP-binding protein
LDVLLHVCNLKKYFEFKGSSRIGRIFSKKMPLYIRAVDGVGFEIAKGETLGLVGESGCGKTTVARCILRLVEPTSGTIIFNGIDLTRLKKEEMRKMRQHMQLVFQDPVGSLNPRLKVETIISEPLRNFGLLTNKKEIRDRVIELLKEVELDEEHLEKYPHELSGGMRQRVGIARALASNPSFVVLDEPTSALDASVGAKILNLLVNLKEKFNMTYLFISHDLNVIRYICDRIAVMYLGKIVESALAEDFFTKPLHPYTNALISALPVANPNIRPQAKTLKGEPTSPINLPSGCRLYPRCPHSKEVCAKIEPELVKIDKDHFVACHLFA